MPEHKDPRFFCSDLDSGGDANAGFFMRDEEEYLALFADSGDAKRVGEACVCEPFLDRCRSPHQGEEPGCQDHHHAA